MSNRLIDLQHITKIFDGEKILDDLNLYIRENEFLTLSVRPDVVKLQHFESSAVFYFRMREVLSLTEKTSHSWLRINAS